MTGVTGVTEEWRNGRVVDPALSETVCVHLVGLSPGFWCGACNTRPDHPDLTPLQRVINLAVLHARDGYGDCVGCDWRYDREADDMLGQYRVHLRAVLTSVGDQ